MGDRGTANQKFTFSSKENFVNVGNGFDWENQWFLAPYSGTYFFSVSGSKDSANSEKTEVHATVNGKSMGYTLSSQFTTFGGFSYQFSVKLNATDKVELFMTFGKTIYLHFTMV